MILILENKSILFYQKDVTLHPWDGSKHDRLGRQNTTALISFNSFFKLERARLLPTWSSGLSDKLSVQQAQASERTHIFHYKLNAW